MRWDRTYICMPSMKTQFAETYLRHKTIYTKQRSTVKIYNINIYNNLSNGGVLLTQCLHFFLLVSIHKLNFVPGIYLQLSLIHCKISLFCLYFVNLFNKKNKQNKFRSVRCCAEAKK